MKPMRMVTTEVQKEASVLIPLVDLGGEPAILYTKRSIYLSSHRGQVSFPGGNKDPTDPNLVTTALRETEEELGIDRNNVDIWGQMPALASSMRGDYAATPVVGFVKDFQLENRTLAENEVSEAFTVKLTTLCDPSLNGHTQFRVPGKPGYSLPVYHGAPHIIWGLTAIMTFQFLRALLPSKMYNHKIMFQSPVI